MFDRFTEGARESVAAAQREAIRLGHNYLGKEHLLLGLVVTSEGLGGRILRELGVTLEVAEQAIVRLVGPGGPGPLGPEEAQALQAIGIDLGEVRRRVEESFGPGALDRVVLTGCRRPFATGALPFTPRAKQALQLAVREAEALGSPSVGTEHLLLGNLRSRGGGGAALAEALGLELPVVRRLVLSGLGRAS